MHILLVEDDGILVDSLQRLFTHHNCSLSCAENLDHAHLAWRQGEFDAVLLDLSLPRGDGLDFQIGRAHV